MRRPEVVANLVGCDQCGGAEVRGLGNAHREPRVAESAKMGQAEPLDTRRCPSRLVEIAAREQVHEPFVAERRRGGLEIAKLAEQRARVRARERVRLGGVCPELGHVDPDAHLIEENAVEHFRDREHVGFRAAAVRLHELGVREQTDVELLHGIELGR